MTTKLLISLFLFFELSSVYGGVDPFLYYTNLSFDTLQLRSYFNQKDYFKNHSTVFNRILQFDKHIRKEGGYGNFIENELFTIRIFPNLGLHLLGGGYDFREMEKWYRYRGYKNSYLWAFLTTYAANWGNEALEISGGEEIIPAQDTIADLLVFDILGKVLFMNDGIYNFFQNELQMRTWLGQPTWLFGEDRYANASVYYAFNPSYFGGETWAPFFLLGIKTAVGLSYQVGEDLYSMATGFFYQEPLEMDDEVYSLSFYWEKNDVLQASFSINDTEGYRFRLNLYPFFSVGTFVGHTYNGEWALGLSFGIPLNVGVAWK